MGFKTKTDENLVISESSEDQKNDYKHNTNKSERQHENIVKVPKTQPCAQKDQKPKASAIRNEANTDIDSARAAHRLIPFLMLFQPNHPSPSFQLDNRW